MSLILLFVAVRFIAFASVACDLAAQAWENKVPIREFFTE